MSIWVPVVSTHTPTEQYIPRDDTHLQLRNYQAFIYALLVDEGLDGLLGGNTLLLEEPSKLVQALILLASLEWILVQHSEVVGPAVPSRSHVSRHLLCISRNCTCEALPYNCHTTAIQLHARTAA